MNEHGEKTYNSQDRGWTPFHYDGTVNAGHLLIVASALGSAFAAVIYLQSDLSRLEIDQERLRMDLTTEVAAIRSDAVSREGRLRATELTIAGQTSDLRAMAGSLARIERLLESR